MNLKEYNHLFPQSPFSCTKGAPRPHDTTMSCDRVKEVLEHFPETNMDDGLPKEENKVAFYAYILIIPIYSLRYDCKEIDFTNHYLFQLHTKFSDGIKGCLQEWQ